MLKGIVGYGSAKRVFWIMRVWLEDVSHRGEAVGNVEIPTPPCGKCGNSHTPMRERRFLSRRFLAGVIRTLVYVGVWKLTIRNSTDD